MDFTLALTAHNETHVAIPALRSAALALTQADRAGLTYEVLVGFDSASDECRAIVTQTLAALELTARCIDVGFRDQGKTRNAIAQQAQGRNLGFLDADDLISENWLAQGMQMLDRAAKTNRKTIIHPELHWQFGGANNVQLNCASDDPLFSHGILAIRNYYDALCLAPTEAYRSVPFAPRDLANGLAYEDHQWIVETLAAGWHHDVARDTVIFKRKRPQSQSSRSRSANSMIRRQDSLRIDRL